MVLLVVVNILSVTTRSLNLPDGSQARVQMFVCYLSTLCLLIAFRLFNIY